MWVRYALERWPVRHRENESVRPLRGFVADSLDDELERLQAKMLPGLGGRVANFLAAVLLLSVVVGVITSGPQVLTLGGSLVLGVAAGFGGMQLLRRTFSTLPRAWWNHEGLTDNSSLISGPLHLTWGNIKSISSRRGLVRIELEESALRSLDLPLSRRVQIALNRIRGFRGFSLDLTLLHVDGSDLAYYLSLAADRSEFIRLREATERRIGDVASVTEVTTESGRGV